MLSIINNKKGWIKIAEAFLAVLLVAGISILVLSQGGFKERSIAPIAKDAETLILRTVQFDPSLRQEILGTSGEVAWENFPTAVPNAEASIKARIPSQLECVGRICEPEGPCAINKIEGKDVYVDSVIITTSSSGFNPRMLKIFCWEKE